MSTEYININIFSSHNFNQSVHKILIYFTIIFLKTLHCHMFETLLIHHQGTHFFKYTIINPLNPELNPICYLLALLGAHHFLHVSRIRVKSLTLKRLMSYIYMEHPFLMFLDHTQRSSTVGRTPLDE